MEALRPLDVPVAAGLSSGHATGPNVTLPLGVRASLSCGDGDARLAVLDAAVEHP
jgi:muramoyltetrapeptide carboxypeptidase LdcA involved in peptidoglycan recycling